MASSSLTDRVAALEVKVGSQTIQEQFRGQAELIDQLFILRFEEHDKKWDEKLEAKLAPIRTDIAHLKVDVAGLKIDVAALKTDLATVKDDVKKILSHLRKRR